MLSLVLPRKPVVEKDIFDIIHEKEHRLHWLNKFADDHWLKIAPARHRWESKHCRCERCSKIKGNP